MKDNRCVRVGWFDNAVIHPFAFSTCRNNPGAAQVSEMARDLGLENLQYRHKRADADLISVYEIKYS